MQMLLGSEPIVKQYMGEECPVTTFVGRIKIGQANRFCLGLAVGDLEDAESGKILLHNGTSADPLELLLSMHVLNGIENVAESTLRSVSEGVAGFLKSGSTDFSEDSDVVQAAEYAEEAIEELDPNVLSQFVEVMQDGDDIINWTGIRRAIIREEIDPPPALSDWVFAQTN